MEITFRPVKRSDLPLIHSWWNDPEIMEPVGAINYHPTLEELQTEYWPTWKNPGPQDYRMFIICADEKPIGEIGYRFTDLVRQTAGFDIKNCERALWGQGIGTTAARLFLNYCFTECGVDAFVIGVRADNSRALALYRRLGFVEQRRYAAPGDRAFAGGEVVELGLSAERFARRAGSGSRNY